MVCRFRSFQRGSQLVQGKALSTCLRCVQDIRESNKAVIASKRQLESIELEAKPRARGIGDRLHEQHPNIRRALFRDELFEQRHG